MKAIICISLGLLLLNTSRGQTIPNFNFQDINGNAVSISVQSQKKTLFIIAPFHEYDSTKIDQLVAFKNQYGDSVNIIGIISIEDGYVDSVKVSMMQMYQIRGLNIVLTAPMYTRKNSSNQTSLLSWLTKKAENKRFNIDVLGVNQKFFMDQTGKLYAVVLPEVPLNSETIIRIMQRKI